MARRFGASELDEERRELGLSGAFGGTPAGNAKAAADAWSRILAFDEETLGR